MRKDNTIIKFPSAKKAIKKSRKDKHAAENRVKFGRTKAEKLRDKQVKIKHISRIDLHKIDKD